MSRYSKAIKQKRMEKKIHHKIKKEIKKDIEDDKPTISYDSSESMSVSLQCLGITLMNI